MHGNQIFLSGIKNSPFFTDAGTADQFDRNYCHRKREFLWTNLLSNFWACFSPHFESNLVCWAFSALAPWLQRPNYFLLKIVVVSVEDARLNKKIVSILCSAVLRLSLKNSIFKLVMLGWRWSQSRTRARAEEKVDLELNNFDSASLLIFVKLSLIRASVNAQKLSISRNKWTFCFVFTRQLEKEISDAPSWPQIWNEKLGTQRPSEKSAKTLTRRVEKDACPSLIYQNYRIQDPAWNGSRSEPGQRANTQKAINILLTSFIGYSIVRKCAFTLYKLYTVPFFRALLKHYLKQKINLYSVLVVNRWILYSWQKFG